MLKVINDECHMLSIVMLSVLMLSVIYAVSFMLNVILAECH
jgi:hypothetical protein